MVRAKAERLVNLTTALLEARAPRTFADLRKQLRDTYDQEDPETARRMFERDKNELRRMGIPIQTTRLLLSDAEGYLIDRDEYELAPLDLTVEEAGALLAGVAMTGGEGERLAVARLTAHLPDPVEPTDTPGLAVSVTDDHLDTVSAAVSSRTTITFTYRRSDGAEAPRTLDPWAVGIRNGVGYVVGHDHDRDDRRVFRLSRIVSRVRTIGDPGAFTRPDDVDLAAELAGPLGEGTDVVVAVEPTAIAAVRARGGRPVDDDPIPGQPPTDRSPGEGSQGARAADDDWVTMLFPRNDPVRLEGWLTGIADRVVVLEPLELHDRVRARLAGLVASLDARGPR